MTISRSALIITTIALILLAFIPTASGETINGEIKDILMQEQYIYVSGNSNGDYIDTPAYTVVYDADSGLIPTAITLMDVCIYIHSLNEYLAYPNYQIYNCTLRYNDRDIATATATVIKNDYIPITSTVGQGYGTIKFQFNNWDYEYLQTLTGKKNFKFYGLPAYPASELINMRAGASYNDSYPVYFISSSQGTAPYSKIGYHIVDFEVGYFKNSYTIDTDEYGTNIFITRIFDGKSNPSKLIIYKNDGTKFYESSTYETGNRSYAVPYGNLTIDIQSKHGKTYRILEDTTEPEPTIEPTIEPTTQPTTQPTAVQPVYRTGSVTMTDHNGTTITGFEVTAVNAYTGQSFTVVTQTDVAVMNLPMDRITEIRNPWTGVYEEAPVGYYRFYGQKPGYKMLNEEGIKVSVMPEKYGTYKLCDILVTGESGPLSGKHQFQIRSRADNSVLQTGTISAKSRTTGIWYNTTVVDGLATLILPYDTSDALYEHAGHYYVYATSPGYEDSDYGTQIIVSPRTVSEVKTILLTPIGGVPTPDNVTLRIDVFSEGGPGVANAEIFIKGVIGAGKDVWDTYTTSSTGYLEVSVPGNSTYDIVASGAGYYDSSRRIEVFMEDPPLIEIKLYRSGAPIVEPTVEPTDWPTGPPTTQPTGGIPDEDDGSGGFLMEAVRGIGIAFGVGFSTAKIIFGMLLALAIGFATAKQLRGGAAEFGLGLLGGTMLGVLVGLIPVWTIVVLLLVVGLYIGHRYVGGGNNG